MRPGADQRHLGWIKPSLGSNRHKGLGVFSFGRYRLARDERYDPQITYAIPVRVEDVEGPTPFHLLALWAHYGLAPLRMSTRGPTLRALSRYRRFLSERPSIVAGDLNNHVRWDKPGKAWSHARAVAAFARLDLVSAYHVFEASNIGPNAIRRSTGALDRSSGPTYHIDYVFIPRASVSQLRSVSVGSRADWIATGLSDHAPLMELDPAPVATLNTPPRPGRSSSIEGIAHERSPRALLDARDVPFRPEPFGAWR